MKPILITGTGTDVGKTGLSLALALKFMGRGLRVGYFKPIQCGNYPLRTNKPGGDSDFILSYAGNTITVGESYFFRDPVSPHLASSREAVQISLEKIREDLSEKFALCDVVLVEFAGGVAVPINDAGDTLFDVPDFRSYPVILAASPELGTLNHTLLSYHFLTDKIKGKIGFAMLHLHKKVPEIFQNNVDTIQNLTSLKYLGEVPFNENLESLNILTGEDQKLLCKDFGDGLESWLGL